jgi:hypothetical protein
VTNIAANANSTITTGTVISGDYTTTHELDGVYWQIEDDAGVIDMYFEFAIIADSRPTSVTLTGRANGINDDLDVFAWNWGAAAWEQIGHIFGQTSTADNSIAYNLFDSTAHVGTGADLGKVRVRFFGTGLTSADFYADQVFLTYEFVTQRVGYANGAIWINTINGTPGIVTFINGTADNPVDNLADAITLDATLGLHRFELGPGSSITLTQAFDNYSFSGESWILALNGQSLSSSVIRGATVSGTCIGASRPHFIESEMGVVTLPGCHLHHCCLEAAITLSAAGASLLDQCFSGVAGIGTPTIDFGAAIGDTQLNMRHYSGGVEILNMGQTGTDNMSLEGHGQLIINASCVGGTVAIRGHFPVTDNAGGAVTLSDDARFTVTGVRDSILSDSTAFPGAFIDVAISSRSDFDETTDPVELLDAGGTAGTSASELVADIEAQLSGTHGAGLWEKDWTAAERDQIRYRLALDGAQVDPTTGIGTIEDIWADTSAIDARLPADPADESLQQASHATTQAAIGALNDLSITDVQAALTAQGYTTTRAPYLDQLAAANMPADLTAVLADTAAMQPLVDVAVSSRSSHSAVDVDTQLTTTHGAGSWQSATATDWSAGEREQIRYRLAIDGSQTDPTTGAGTLEDILADTSAVDGRLPADPADESLQQASHSATQAAVALVETEAAASIREATNTAEHATTLAAVLLNETEVAAAARQVTNIAEHDATQAAVAALNDLAIADIQTAMTNQGYTTGRAPGLDNLDVAVSTRSVPGDAMALTPTERLSLAAVVDSILSAAHGSGSWESSSDTDWTALEREQIRFRLAMDGDQQDPTTDVGTLEDILAAATRVIPSGS